MRYGFGQDEIERLDELHGLLSIGGGNINHFTLLRAAIRGKLFDVQPHALNANIAHLATLLGTGKQVLVAAALKHPQLFGHTPLLLDANATRSAELLGLVRRDFVAAGLKQPALLYERPEIIEANARRTAELLDVTKQQFIAAALKLPQLFNRDPATVKAKVAYIKAIAEAVGRPMDTAMILSQMPVAIAYSKKHLHLRYVLARTGHAKSVSTAIVMPHAKVEATIIRYYAGKARTLRIMRMKGLIKDLPDCGNFRSD